MLNNEIMLSIKPEWCRKIITGEKTIEVRLRSPKLNPPFKCYIYQTLPKYGDWNDQDGHVIAEFTCDNIYWFPYGITYSESECAIALITMAQLSVKQVNEYGKGRTLHGFHISDLKVYKKPRSLSDFESKGGIMKRPPQSWCYCKEREA